MNGIQVEKKEKKETYSVKDYPHPKPTLLPPTSDLPQIPTPYTSSLRAPLGRNTDTITLELEKLICV